MPNTLKRFIVDVLGFYRDAYFVILDWYMGLEGIFCLFVFGMLLIALGSTKLALQTEFNWTAFCWLSAFPVLQITAGLIAVKTGRVTQKVCLSVTKAGIYNEIKSTILTKTGPEARKSGLIAIACGMTTVLFILLLLMVQAAPQSVPASEETGTKLMKSLIAGDLTQFRNELEKESESACESAGNYNIVLTVLVPSKFYSDVDFETVVGSRFGKPSKVTEDVIPDAFTSKGPVVGKYYWYGQLAFGVIETNNRNTVAVIRYVPYIIP
jgi:hypothetical protein